MSIPAPLDASPAPTAPAADAPPAEDGWPGGLPALRQKLDHIDDALHDLLMQRALVVEHVARSGKRSAYRPGREAAIIRRLLARHNGNLPPQTLVRIWRELLAGTTAMQGSFCPAVCQSGPGSELLQMAREHFGALTPVLVHSSPGQAITQLTAGTASVAVLPLPSETEPPQLAWWTGLMHRERRIHIVARLPFWARRPEHAPAVPALVVAMEPPDPSGEDRTLLGVELDRDLSRARLSAALAAAGLASGATIVRRDPGAPVAQALLEIDGFLAEDDPRLARLDGVLRQPVVLGAYAIPVAGGAA
jgi:chorismate mutase/prephenate dehydratase